MLMHSSAGHVTLLLAEFHPRPLNFPPIKLMVPDGLVLGFAQIFLYYFFYFIREDTVLL